MKRGSSTSPTNSRLVEPTSVTTHAGAAAASASRTAPGSTRTGAATKAAVAPASASAGVAHAVLIAPCSSARVEHPRRRVVAAYLGVEPLARGEPDGPTHEPDAEDGDDQVLNGGERLAGDRGRPLDELEVVRELVGVERLRPVADRGLRVRVDLHDDPVGAHRGGCQRQRQHEVAPPGGVARVDDDRQVRELLEHRHRRQVERVAVGGLERADPALAQQHVRVALLEDVLRRHQQLVERRGDPALEQRRAPGAADLGQQRVVLHVASADLDDVGHLEHRLEVARVHQLGDDRQPGLGLGLREQPQALLAEALEGVGRGAGLVGAAAQQRAAGVLHDARRRHQLVARLHRAGPGDHREVLAADLPAVDLDDRALADAQLTGGQLVGLQDRHRVVDPGCALEFEASDVLDVPDRADHGHRLPARRMRTSAHRLDPLDDGLDLVLRRRRFHDNHHLVLLGFTPLDTLRTTGARQTGRRPVLRGRAPREIARWRTRRRRPAAPATPVA